MFALYHPYQFASIQDAVSDGEYLYALFKEREDLYIRRYDLPRPTRESWKKAFKMFEEGVFGERVLKPHDDWSIRIPLPYCFRIQMDFSTKEILIVPSGLEHFQYQSQCKEQMGWTIHLINIGESKGYNHERWCRHCADGNPEKFQAMLTDDELRRKNAYFHSKDVDCRFPLFMPDIESYQQLNGIVKLHNHLSGYFIGGVPLENNGLSLYFAKEWVTERKYDEYDQYLELARKTPITIWKFHKLYQPATAKMVHDHNILHL